MKFFKKTFNSNNGQVMVEALVAITVVVIGLFAVFALLLRSLTLNRLSADQFISANLAAEGIEVVKNLIDKNTIQNKPWNLGIEAGDYQVSYNDTSLTTVFIDGAPLKFDKDTGYYNYVSGDNTRFVRKISVSLPGSDEIKVISNVKWITTGGLELNATLEDHFFNWR